MIPRRSKVKRNKLSSEHKKEKNENISEENKTKTVAVRGVTYQRRNYSCGETVKKADKMHISAMKGNIVVYRKLCIIGKQKQNIFINKKQLMGQNKLTDNSYDNRGKLLVEGA